jgi:hypothetical protein
VHYEGEDFVCHKGVAEGSADPLAVARLVAGLERLEFAKMPDYVQRDVTDLPMATLSLARGEAVHRVQHYHGDHSAPGVLGRIEDRIDAVAGTAQWVGAAAAGSSSSCEVANASEGRG